MPTKKDFVERSESRKEWSLIHAITFLTNSKKIIDWVGSAQCPFGYETIWEYCAGEHHGRNLRPAQKAEIAKDNAIEMRNGFARLKERLFEEWWRVLLMVPRKINTQQIVVITLDNDYVVNLDGETAHDIQIMRDEKLVRGQLKSSYQRSARLIGKDQAVQSMESILNTVALQPLSLPRGNQMASPDMFSQQHLLG